MSSNLRKDICPTWASVVSGTQKPGMDVAGVKMKKTVEDDDGPQRFRCRHGNVSTGEIVQGYGIAPGPHYASKKCIYHCCVHGVASKTHCEFCASDGERFGWDGSVGGCRCLRCFSGNFQ